MYAATTLLLLLHTRVVLFLLSLLSLYQFSEYISNNEKKELNKNILTNWLLKTNQPLQQILKKVEKTIASLMPLIRYLCFLVFPFLRNVWGSFSNAFLFYDFFVLKNKQK